jgi:hypothetical protein
MNKELHKVPYAMSSQKLGSETNLFDITIPYAMSSQKSNNSRYNIKKSGLKTREKRKVKRLNGED